MVSMQIPRGRGLRTAIILGAGIAVLLLVVLPVADIFAEQADDIEQSKQLLAFYNAQIASRPQLEAQLATLHQLETSTAGLVTGNSAALAAANMQTAMKALVESHGGQVRSVQNLPPSPANGFEKIEIQYDLSVPVGGLKGLLYAVETHQPYFFLDRVDVRIPEGWQNEGPVNTPPDLQIHLTVQAYHEAEVR